MWTVLPTAWSRRGPFSMRPTASIRRSLQSAGRQSVPTQLAGHSIKRGTMIVIAPDVLHRHRTLWPDPDRFDPTRFLDGARHRISRFAYLPFGAGPRVCIGATFALQEAAIVLATFMCRCRLELLPGHATWPVQRVSLRPRGGLPMIVRE